jgi:hypothetical protein
MNDDSTDVDGRRYREAENQHDGQTDWESVAADPGPGSLGYGTSEWERVPVSDDEDQVIFLPGNEEDLADDAFIVLAGADLCDPVTRR